MDTMSDHPHLNHVPTRAGGYGRVDVHAFYRDHLVGRFFPSDVTMEGISRTVGESSIVEEIYISFTHTAVVDWLLPGVAPTGKPVELVVAAQGRIAAPVRQVRQTYQVVAVAAVTVSQVALVAAA